METIKCNNHLCGKEYNIQFNNCPFCGTPNPKDDLERNNMASSVNENNRVNGLENNKFNIIVVSLIWISIVFFGIRGIMSSFANIIFSPGIGCLTLVLSIIGMVSLFFILRAKKWALFMWIAYRLATGIVNGFISSKIDFATNIIIAIANIGLMVLILQIKKNGESAWSIIFKKYESRTIEDSINPSLKEGAIVGNQDGMIPNIETEFHTKKLDNKDETTIKQDRDKEDNKQERINNPNKWAYWCIIGLFITILAAGICLLVKPNKDNKLIEQIDSSSTDVFDCGLFSFEYPKTFKTSPIQNAPHMVLKLESNDCFITASYWDYGFSDDVSIWDNELYEYCSQMPIDDGELVDISKESIKTKGGLRHCLRIIANSHKNVNGSIVDMKMLSYLILQNGYLLNFTFGSEGEYIKGNPIFYPEKIMEGLCLKTNEEISYEESFKTVNTDGKKDEVSNNINPKVHNEMVSIAESYNEDLPQDLGFGMTMISCGIENRSLVYVIQWKGVNSTDFSSQFVAEQKDALVENLKENTQAFPSFKALLNTMKKNDYDFIYRYVNENGQRLYSISVSTAELL